MVTEQVVELARALRHTFESYRQLIAAARQVPPEDLSSLKDLIEPTLLVDMVKNRLLTGKVFETLVAVDIEPALQVLFQRFLGDVNPDRCYGGFTYDVSLMLHSLRSAAGDDAIRLVLRSPSFNTTMLTDPRFLEALTEALEIDEADLAAWMQR